MSKFSASDILELPVPERLQLVEDIFLKQAKTVFEAVEKNPGRHPFVCAVLPVRTEKVQ